MLSRKLCICLARTGVRYSSGAFRYDRILRESKRDFDLDYGPEGEVIVEPPAPTLTGSEVSRDPKEWACVERILPPTSVPEPPRHESYPTPSGWRPVTADLNKETYFMRRSRFHNYPIYHEISNGGSRHMTVIKHIEGDIWALEGDLRKFLENETKKRVYTQVDEVCCKIRVRGTVLEEVTKFMVNKGF